MWRVNVTWPLSQESSFKDLCVEREKEQRRGREEGRKAEERKGTGREKRGEEGEDRRQRRKENECSAESRGLWRPDCRAPAVGQV